VPGETIMKEFGLQDIGRYIQAARKAKKKTQDEVANAIEITKKRFQNGNED